MTGPTLLSAIQDGVQSKFSLDKLLAHFSIPVQSHFVKKNSRNIFRNRATGRSFPGKSPELINAEKNLCIQLRCQAGYQKLVSPINEPIWAVFHFYFKHEDYFNKPKLKKDSPRMKLTIGDLTNLIQLPEDCLESAGIIENDALICSLDLSRRIVGDETKLEIFLLRMDSAEWKSSPQ